MTASRNKILLSLKNVSHLKSNGFHEAFSVFSEFAVRGRGGSYFGANG